MAPLVSVITTLYYVAIIFIVECGIARFLCAMCVFEVWVSSSPIGSFVQKFVSFAASIAELEIAYRTQSLTQLI